jgi:predicted DNA binding CopG/RHH family protein
MTKAKKPGTAEAWEKGELGENAKTAKVASAQTTQAINDALGLQMISIRLPRSVIEDFKVIASIEGVGYQPLMRIALTRFAECEAKRVMREYAAQLEADKKAATAATAKATAFDRSEHPDHEKRAA